MDFADITKDLQNGENMGGIAMKVYYGLHADVDVWPAKPAAPATLEANGGLTGNLTMKLTKRMFTIDVTDDAGEFKIEPVGEIDGKSFIMRLTIFSPGLQKKLLGFINAVKNSNLVFIVPDNNGEYFLMGDALRAATYQGPGDGMGTGKETASRRGVGMEFAFKCSNVYAYEGTIPLTVAAG